jgi:aspartate kinase
MKFGGTSVGDARRMREITEIVRNCMARRPVVVASAMSGVTDLLLSTAQSALRKETAQVREMINALSQKHSHIARALVTRPENRDELIGYHACLLEELDAIYQGVGLLAELSPRSLDAIASFGERFSCSQIAAVFEDAGIAAEYVDARELIRTDANFGQAAVDFTVTYANIQKALAPLAEKNIVPVVTGFIAATNDGITTTLGRSGSDYTGAIVGAALGSEEIWIWTDVDGVMTADPRCVAGAQHLPEISYLEAAEMSYFGAKVIHPKTMLPAIENNIPIRIKNTFNPSHPGTLISNKTGSAPGAVKNVTSIDDLALVAVEGHGMMGVPGVAARIFTALARADVNIMMISQASSEHNVCLVIPQKDQQRAVEALQREFAADIAGKMVDGIRLREGVAIIAVVGEGMHGVPGVAGKTFTAAARENVNIIAVAQGSSELNISLVVDQCDVRRAIQAIHDAFMGALDGNCKTPGNAGVPPALS